jgi:hypothetical protein
MKIREWEIREHLQEVIGEYDDAFDRLDPGGILYAWVVKPGFRIYQFGEKISIGGSVINTDYFSPNLAKITQSSLELAYRMLEDSDDDEGTTNPYVVKRLFS